MSQLSIRQALETALSTVVPALPTAYENQAFSPPAASSPYQRAFLLFAEPDNPEAGHDLHVERGIFQVSLYYPVQAGDGAGRTQAELVRQKFRRASTFSKSGINVIIERTPEIGQGTVDGGMWHIPVKIRFFANV